MSDVKYHCTKCGDTYDPHIELDERLIGCPRCVQKVLDRMHGRVQAHQVDVRDPEQLGRVQVYIQKISGLIKETFGLDGLV